MASAGLCCSSLEEPKALMKMGLSMILIGHVNFLLGALVHGVVLRHINLHKQARAMEYAISNVVALTSGLVGIVVGILAIILSKNKRSRGLTWSLFSVSLAASIMAAASAIGLLVSVVMAIIHGGRSLLTHCRFPNAIGYSSITNECPFDPTRIYSTTLILWVPLIVTCVIQMVFCARCSGVCVSFLGLHCCPNRKIHRDYGRAINVVRPMEKAASSDYSEPWRTHSESPSCYSEPPRTHSKPSSRYSEPPRTHSKPSSRCSEPPRTHSKPSSRCSEPPRTHSKPSSRYTEPPRTSSEPASGSSEPPRSHHEPPRQNTAPPRRQHQTPQHPPRQHRSLPPSERQPLRQPSRERSSRERQETRTGSQQRAPEQHRLLERNTFERSSFWI